VKVIESPAASSQRKEDGKERLERHTLRVDDGRVKADALLAVRLVDADGDLARGSA
jgi:hypothetical protein